MSNLELQNWANKIDIWKDKKSDGDFVDIKNKLVKDMENLWNLKLQWKITQEEYSRYWMKFREILEKNFTSKKEIQKRYEETRKEIMEETKQKTQGEQRGLLEKLWFRKREEKKEINENNLENYLFKWDFIKNLQNFVNEKEWIKLNMKNTKILEKTLEKSLLWDQKFFSNFMNKYTEYNKNKATCDWWEYFYKMTERFQKLHFEVENKNQKLEKWIIKLIGKEKWKELLLVIKNANPCSTNLIKIIDKFAKDNNLKITFKEIKNISNQELEVKKAVEKSKQDLMLLKAWISQKEIDKAHKTWNYITVEKILPEEYKKIFNDSKKRIRVTENAKKRLKVLNENDFKVITDPKNENKSSQEIMKILEKQNEKLAQLNNKIKKEEDPLYNPKNDKKPEQNNKNTQEQKNQNYEKIATNIERNTLINISDITSLPPAQRKWLFDKIFENVDKWQSKKLIANGIEFSISWNKWSYEVKYWDRIISWLTREKVKESISFARFLKPLWLDFLILHSAKIINRINEISTKWLKIHDEDWMNVIEQDLCLEKLGKVILGENYKHNNELEDNKKQFTRIKSNPIKYNNSNFTSLELLAKEKFKFESGNELNINKLLDRIS